MWLVYVKIKTGDIQQSWCLLVSYKRAYMRLSVCKLSFSPQKHKSADLDACPGKIAFVYTLSLFLCVFQSTDLPRRGPDWRHFSVSFCSGGGCLCNQDTLITDVIVQIIWVWWSYCKLLKNWCSKFLHGFEVELVTLSALSLACGIAWWIFLYLWKANIWNMRWLWLFDTISFSSLRKVLVLSIQDSDIYCRNQMLAVS